MRKTLNHVRLILFLSLACLIHGQTYFVGISFSKRTDLDQLIKSTFEKKLAALGEQPIASTTSNIMECYRFMWLRTSLHPVALRIDILSDGTAFFSLRVADGRGGYDPGKLYRSERWKLSEAQLNSFKKTFTSADFFKQTVAAEGGGLDGSTWLVEANINGHYHAVSRWSPKDGAVRDVGMAFLKIAMDDFSPIF